MKLLKASTCPSVIINHLKRSTYFKGDYDEEKDGRLLANMTDEKTELTKEWYEKAGQSRRIWGELYKVIFKFHVQ
jgi:hypothetical protein